MLELSIPQPNVEGKATKDLIFTILTREQSLSMIELLKKVQKEYNISVTYQAVRKAVNALLKQGVLQKTNKKLSISKSWILKSKSFFDNLLLKYDSGKQVHSFSQDISKEDYAVYTFNSLLDLDNFWGDVMIDWARKANSKEKHSAVCYGHYAWWLLINLGRESKIFESFMKKRIPTYFIFFRDLPLNQWASKIYQDIGLKTVFSSKKVDGSVGVNIYDDLVIQVKYPPKIIKKIKSYFEKYNNVQEMSLKEITTIAHTPCEIKFIMFRNPTMAQNLRDTYLKYF